MAEEARVQRRMGKTDERNASNSHDVCSIVNQTITDWILFTSIRFNIFPCSLISAKVVQELIEIDLHLDPKITKDKELYELRNNVLGELIGKVVIRSTPTTISDEMIKYILRQLEPPPIHTYADGAQPEHEQQPQAGPGKRQRKKSIVATANANEYLGKLRTYAEKIEANYWYLMKFRQVNDENHFEILSFEITAAIPDRKLFCAICV